MGSLVKLYVYDLSNGLAQRLSRQLTGRQIDGIWHTSVIAFGKEIFYGQGISVTNPGQSHHGQPLQVVDMGETAIDEETFTDYLQEMNQVYTADKYHLLDFNCNSFTNDCVGFLTGGSIPSWIKDLPSDFLSTPFGAALRPTIDDMFRRPAPTPTGPPPPATSPITSSLLQAVAAQATGPSQADPRSYHPTSTTTPSALPLTAISTVAGPLQVCSNLQHFKNILSNHKAVSVFFTSRTCPPCQIVEPVFEDIASQKASNGVAFVKIELDSILGGGQIANLYGVRATPTFLFFLEGNKIHELKGANVPELKTRVDLLVVQAFPAHPHASLPLPATWSISLDPILFSQIPPLDTVQTKLYSFIDSSGVLDDDKVKSKELLSSTVFPCLKARFEINSGNGENNNLREELSNKVCEALQAVTTTMLSSMPAKELFPLQDLWRIGLLDKSIASWCASMVAGASRSPPHVLLLQVSSLIHGDNACPKSLLLTSLRMASNMFSEPALARTLLSPQISSFRQSLTTLVIPALLHHDVGVRMSAASLTFNVAAHYQRPRVGLLRSGRRGDDSSGEDEGDGEWEVEMVSAVVEAIRTENSSEDVVHRLAATLALFIHLSPFYDEHLKPLMDVLQTRSVLLAKLSGGEEGCGDKGVKRKDIRDVIEEIANKLCN